MDFHTGRKRPFPAMVIVSVLFLLCIIPGQFLINTLFPEIFGRAGINPSLVILDIPNPLPVTIDLILVPGLFLLIYPLVILFYPSRGGIPSWQQAVQRTWSVFAGGFILLFCMLAGGSIYYLAQGYLPRNVRNGINSFGINADIYLPYPRFETIHLRGSMVLLVSFVVGISICIRKIRKEPGMRKVGRLTREQRMTPYERMMQEKRIKEKRPDENYSHQESTLTKPATIRKPASIKPETDRLERNLPQGVCHSHPVMTFEPEAVNYMPRL